MNQHAYQPIHDLTKSIARELGAQWQYSRKDSSNADGDLHWFATIIGPEGARIDVGRSQDDRSKISINGNFRATEVGTNKPMGAHDVYGVERPKRIYVAESRGAVVIAREIQRRLLPEYTAALTLFNTKVADHNAYLTKQANTTAAVNAIIDERDPDVGVNISGDRVRLDFRDLTVDQARALVAAFKACRKAKAS